MEYKQIRRIKTIIKNKRQLAVLGFDNGEFVFLIPTSVVQKTGLEIFEFELLIGSSIKIDFYKKGEMMFKGICQKDDLFVKMSSFKLQKPVEQLRVENRDNLLPFKRITGLFYYHKFNRDNVGIKTDDGNVTLISLKRFEIQSNLERDEQYLLEGSYMCPEYYKIGDILSNGSVANTDKVLKWLNIRYSSKDDYFESEDIGSRRYGYDSWNDLTLAALYDGNAESYWNID
jgi:hypothetical protein